MYELNGFKFSLGYLKAFPEGHPREGEVMKKPSYEFAINSTLFKLAPKKKGSAKAEHGLTRAFEAACGMLNGKWAVGRGQSCVYIDVEASSIERNGRLLKVALRSGSHFKEGGTIRNRDDADLADIHVLDSDQVVD